MTDVSTLQSSCLFQLVSVIGQLAIDALLSKRTYVGVTSTSTDIMKCTVINDDESENTVMMFTFS